MVVLWDSMAGWWFGTWMDYFSIQLGISSSQLTNSIIFQRGGEKTTNQITAIFRSLNCFQPESMIHWYPNSWASPEHLWGLYLLQLAGPLLRQQHAVRMQARLGSWFYRYLQGFKHWGEYCGQMVGGLEHEFYFSIYWECHHPNWLSYFSEGWLNHQPEMMVDWSLERVVIKGCSIWYMAGKKHRRLRWF